MVPNTAPMQGPVPILIGVDEVGRGAGFGPLVVAAVATPDGWRDPAVKDSKAYRDHKDDPADAQRFRVAGRIRQHAEWVVSAVDVGCINDYGMNQAMSLAMGECCRRLVTHLRDIEPTRPIEVVVDGDDLHGLDVPGPVSFRCQPRADAAVFEVSAASVVAKAHRDRLIDDCCQRVPDWDGRYDLLKNKGYLTPRHIEGLRIHGPCEQHRSRFVQSALLSKSSVYPTSNRACEP